MVIDLGSGSIKGGLGSSAYPAAILESERECAYQKFYSGTSFLGSFTDCETDLFEESGRLVERGHLVRAESLPPLVQSLMEKATQQTEARHPVLLSEPALTPLKEKAKRASVMFEGDCTSRLFLANQGVVALWGLGLTEGLVIESGEDLTQVVPVIGGHAIPHASEKTKMGGRDVTAQVELFIRRRGYCVPCARPRPLFEKIKQKNCELSASSLDGQRFSHRSSLYESDIKKRYGESIIGLPDGEELMLGEEKFGAAEIIFNPARAALQPPSLPEMIDFVLQRIEPELQRFMVKTLCVSGGNTMLKGFAERLENELKALLPYKNPTHIYAHESDRALGVWKGGATLVQLSSFDELWISKREWAEFGERILLHKQL